MDNCPIKYIQAEDCVVIIPVRSKDQKAMELYIQEQISAAAQRLVPLVVARTMQLMEKALRG
jgi:hypothetical protein